MRAKNDARRSAKLSANGCKDEAARSAVPCYNNPTQPCISSIIMVEITSLMNDFKGDVVESSSADYRAAIARWAANSERKARYVVFPKDENDVSAAVKFATTNAIPLAIKCGGHNPSGASSVEDGLCIDLSRYFDTARVDLARKVVHVGGGALWSTVDRATIAHGLGTPGGTVNHTGVGGLILGGGFGWLSGEHGLVIDNLVQATVVTANGSIVTASSTSHPDLFWGIRGGGCNFGIVTEFVIKVFPQRKTVFAGPIVFPPTLLDKVAEAVDKWWPGIGEKEGAMLVLSRGPGPDRQPAVVMMLFYNGSEEEGRANFKHFYDLGPVADFASEVPYENLNGLQNQNLVHGRNAYMASDFISYDHEVFEYVTSASSVHPTHSTLPPFDVLVGYEFMPLGKICAVPADAMAYRSRGPQPNVALLVFWDKEEQDGSGLQHARGFCKELAKVIEATEERQPYENENEGYGNYVSDISSMEGKALKLWGKNYSRLQKIKREYDPGVVFNRWFPIQPAAQ
ncbi:FAD-binding domain-containing protein [Ramaria rubella]|nr:FAD-binding domain-containing protein [Ramaria rubella]